MRAGDRSRFHVVLMPSHFSCVLVQALWLFYSTSEELSTSATSLEFFFFFFTRFLSSFLACVVALSSGPGGKCHCDFCLVCLDVVSEVLCFLTC